MSLEIFQVVSLPKFKIPSNSWLFLFFWELVTEVYVLFNSPQQAPWWLCINKGGKQEASFNCVELYKM